jgi:predicted MPP superfamily phosphohydrolase
LNWSILFRWIVLALFVIGHIGFWVSLFNRINATGLHRATIKAIEKGIVLVCLILPLLLMAFEGTNDPLRFGDLSKLSPWSYTYSLFAIGFGLIAGPMWLLHRPQFQTASDRYRTVQTDIDKHLHQSNPQWLVGSHARKSLKLPGNQLMHLETNTKSLLLDRIPDRLVGLRIGHLSDIHLTGEIPPEYFRHALEWLVSQEIHLLCLSGDIIDKPEALPSLPMIFGDLGDSMPKLFVLGNHDRACGLDSTVRRVMTQLGWLDCGQCDYRLETPLGQVVVLGNERPWFHRETTPGFLTAEAQADEFRLGISHSPDQFAWGKKQDLSLLLCGHTHGGQIRFPWIGPIIAPSKYGSRFASGIFYQSPTLMHVSRGISGVHPIRLGCLPEVSVLELRKYK